MCRVADAPGALPALRLDTTAPVAAVMSITGYTASGLARRTTTIVYGPRADGSCTYPPNIAGTDYRRVLLTEAHERPDGGAYGHRRPDGSHYNTVANRRCTQCILETELTYLRTMWRASLPRRRGGRR